MMKSEDTLLSVRVRSDLAIRLERLATATRRSKSYLAAQAIEEYVILQERQVQAIQEGIAATNRAEVVSHENASIKLQRWGEAHDCTKLC